MIYFTTGNIFKMPYFTTFQRNKLYQRFFYSIFAGKDTE